MLCIRIHIENRQLKCFDKIWQNMRGGIQNSLNDNEIRFDLRISPLKEFCVF